MERHTRVQIAIIENNKYILVKQVNKKEDIYFWGIPGGGQEEGETIEEAAVREAYEETGLNIKLFPIKFEKDWDGKPYKKLVTFVAKPIGGKAIVGCEPEEDSVWDIVDIKWQGLCDDNGIDSFTQNIIMPVRNYVKNNTQKFFNKA